MRLGALHRPAPPAVPRLRQRAALAGAAPPPEVDWFTGLDLTDPLGNDRYGDCVEVAAFRQEQLWRAHAWGDAWRPSTAEVLARYGDWAGFDPARPETDRGTDTVQAMTAWSTAGIRLGAQVEDVPVWVALDPLDQLALRLAIAWFGGVQLTYALPLAVQGATAWAAPCPADAPPWGTHRVLAGKYDDAGHAVASWGQVIPVAPEFHQRHCLAADAMVSRLWLDARGISPPGLDLPALQQQAARLGHAPPS